MALVMTALIALLLIHLIRQQLRLWADQQVIAALQRHKLETESKSAKTAPSLTDALAWGLFLAALFWALTAGA